MAEVAPDAFLDALRAIVGAERVLAEAQFADNKTNPVT